MTTVALSKIPLPVARKLAGMCGFWPAVADVRSPLGRSVSLVDAMATGAPVLPVGRGAVEFGSMVLARQMVAGRVTVMVFESLDDAAELDFLLAASRATHPAPGRVQ